MKAPRLLAGTCAFVAIASTGLAANDHLKCYKIKDPLPKALYRADLPGLTAEPGCTIKTPAKLLCVGGSKDNIVPTPPGGGPSGGNEGRFVCYKISCKRLFHQVPVKDQFGSRTLLASTSKLLCAPASPSGAFVDDSANTF